MKRWFHIVNVGKLALQFHFVDGEFFTTPEYSRETAARLALQDFNAVPAANSVEYTGGAAEEADGEGAIDIVLRHLSDLDGAHKKHVRMRKQDTVEALHRRAAEAFSQSKAAEDKNRVEAYLYGSDGLGLDDDGAVLGDVFHGQHQSEEIIVLPVRKRIPASVIGGGLTESECSCVYVRTDVVVCVCARAWARVYVHIPRAKRSI